MMHKVNMPQVRHTINGHKQDWSQINFDTLDVSFIHTVLLTLHSFSSPEELLDVLMLRYNFLLEFFHP